MNNQFDHCKTYSWDEPLFEKLGLEPFYVKIYEKHFVGEVNLEDGSSYIKIWVEGLPAQFWDFEVFCAKNKRIYKIETGSGCLGDYWFKVKKIADGVFDDEAAVEELIKELKGEQDRKEQDIQG